MKKILLATLALFMCVNLSFAKEYKDSKFTPLFNGKDFNGWYIKNRVENPELAKKIFAIENKAIRVFGEGFPAEYEIGKRDTHGLIYTEKKYSRYILRFKYKWGKNIANNFSQYQYDAGVYYHVVNDRIWPDGIEYQVRYNHLKNQNHTGDFYIAPKVNFSWYSDGKGAFVSEKNGGKKVERNPNHLQSVMKDAKFNALNDEWNVCEIIVMSNKYCIHKLNGEIVNMVTDIDKYTEGVIGFQCETAEIYYKDIIILEFEKDQPIEDFIK